MKLHYHNSRLEKRSILVPFLIAIVTVIAIQLFFHIADKTWEQEFGGYQPPTRTQK